MTSRIAAVLALAAVSFAQDPRATITGQVTDPTGFAIPGAKIHVVQRGTNAVRDAESNHEGYFTIPFLQPSTYDVEVSANGFNKLRRQNVILLVAQKLEMDVKLEVGSVAEQITVSVEVSALQTSDASGGLNFDSLMTSEYPLNGRQVYMLMDLAPGVLFTQEQFGASGFSGTRGWDCQRLLRHERRRLGHQQFLAQRRAHQPHRQLAGRPQRRRHPGIQGDDEHL